ncbi:hypothetical protein JX266_009339 [Neoarthrinium moseri]|uniref:uncharacterized protein n=1 Tax=Neoarthrinium moseri TaxID=1658444 RepID=UPI001FDC01AE|nr:uncharacterized protein JN550_006907 [Neoarthrinium moseri]KAI1844452.1 hypothetical protein JX266_009339 [Neoarthrinium moseri]KAI1867766.1 hypothetical protein JN550_006907 [Neoarthrinium moseri]
MSLLSSVSAALLLLGSCQAHFLLKSPAPVGVFKDDDEPNAPCGGYTPDFSTNTITNFAVGGDAISTQSSHPQTNYLYRITTDQSAGGNWTEIYPIVQQSGLNTFCVPAVTVPESYVGQTAVLSVVANGPDGLLYQCAAVKFVSGANSNIPSTCTNTSGVTGSFTSDDTLSALASSAGSSSNSSSTSGTSSSTSSASSPTNTKNAGVATYGSLEGLRSFITAGMMMAVGAALVF